MKIVAIGDVHNEDLDVPEGDVIVVAGDITHVGPIEFAEKFIDKLKGKVLAVPGNMDPKGVLDILEAKGVSIHRKVVEIDGITFFGFGGSSPTPFNTPFEFDDEEIDKSISGFKADIAIFHDTPYGFFDWVGGKSVGSMAIRRWVESVKPKLVFCAHIHEHEGVAKINDTLIVKVPPAYKGRCVVVQFDNFKSIIIKFASLKT
jgi:Icc-related predicted phosphoesterase